MSMKVLNLKKRSEKKVYSFLALLLLFTLMLLKLFSPQHIIYELIAALCFFIALVLFFLAINCKHALTVCRHGIYYHSIWGHHYIAAQEIKLIQHYSKCGLSCIFIIGPRFIIFAPFYCLTSKQMHRLKRYDYNLLQWLQVSNKRDKFYGSKL